MLQSVLHSIQAFSLVSLFSISRVIRTVEEIFLKFLWRDSHKGVACAKVAWGFLFSPKKEGGLGLKGIEIWNKVTCLKHIWNILQLFDQ